MNIMEHAVLFACEGDELVGIIARPAGSPSRLGVLVIVGGPQYRVGSHRQFVLLSRSLAKAGIACMRFDYRGMGDADGAARSFDAVIGDVASAVDEFMRQVPELDGVVLWGLCDGASAACLYAPGDTRVAGLVLLNPWVRTDTGEARTVLRYYYLRRLVDPRFWKKLLGGGVPVLGSLGGLVGTIRRARSGAPRDPGDVANDVSLPGRMQQAVSAAARPMMLLLSGRDYVAREFEQLVADDRTWSDLCNTASMVRLEQADHTFSSERWRTEVARLTADWVIALQGRNQEDLRCR